MSDKQREPARVDTDEAREKQDSGVPVQAQRLATERVTQIIEAALLAAEGPLTVDNLFRLFSVGELDKEEGRKQVRESLDALQSACEQRGVMLQKVASGYRYQTRQELSPWVSRLWEEKPPRYTRALLETLALVAYQQPVTRGDIEQVRGVSVSQNIMRTLVERDWIRVVGQREAPGRPSMYGTTKAFLDYFNLGKLDDLPPLEEIKAMIEPTLVMDETAAGETAAAAADAPGSADIETLNDSPAAAGHVALSSGQESEPNEATAPQTEEPVQNS